MKRKLIFFVTILILGSTIKAQMKDWTWSQYKIKFKLPSYMNVTENNSDTFIATAANINVTIYPRSGENLETSKIKSLLRKWARDSSVRDFTEPTYLEDLNGYWGYYLEGFKENSNIFQMLIVDPDYPDIYFYIWISYNEDIETVASEILLSFKPQ